MKKNNLPAVPGETFALTTKEDTIAISPELAKMIDGDDLQGYEVPSGAFPIVSIRQKEALNDKGVATAPAGGFKIYDAVTNETETAIPDVGGATGLLVTILADKASRVRFPGVGSDKPSCRSVDGIIGTGDPGGKCSECPHSQFTADRRPDCTLQREVLVWDHNLQGCYIFRLGPSALRPFDLFKAAIERRTPGAMRIPLHALKVTITTTFKQEPERHFVPHFEVVDQVNIESFREFKKLRIGALDGMRKTAEIQTVDDVAPMQDADYETVDDKNELPKGVTKIDGVTTKSPEHNEMMKRRAAGETNDNLPF